MNNLQRRLKTQEIDQKITKEVLYDLYITKGMTCKQNGKGLQTASLDRIDNTKGYIIGNLAWCHKDINLMKWKFDLFYLYELCKMVNDHVNK